MTPLEFLKLLWLNKPEGQFILLWTLPRNVRGGSASSPPPPTMSAASTAGTCTWGWACRSRTTVPHTAVFSDEIATISGFWADLDLRSEAHTTKALPATIADALSIIPASMQPTIVIATGNGAHAWWLFKEPYVFDDDEDRKAVACLVARWASLLRLNAGRRGWAFDRLSIWRACCGFPAPSTRRTRPTRRTSSFIRFWARVTTCPTSRSSWTMRQFRSGGTGEGSARVD